MPAAAEVRGAAPCTGKISGCACLLILCVGKIMQRLLYTITAILALYVLQQSMPWPTVVLCQGQEAVGLGSVPARSRWHLE